MSDPTYTLAELLEPENLDAARARLLANLQGAGFPALTEWVPKAGVEMTFVDMVAGADADLVAADIPSTTAGGFLGKATGKQMDLHAERFYLNERVGATKTTFNMDLVCASTAGPYTFDVEDVEILGSSGKRYRNTTGGEVVAGGRVTLAFEALEAGAARVDDPSDVVLVTTFAGVSIEPAAPTFSSTIQTGASTGRIVPSAAQGENPGAHTYAIRIDAAGDPGTARFSLNVDGEDFQDMGLLRASTPIGHGIVLAVFRGVGSPASFLDGDTFTFTAPGGPGYVQGGDAESEEQLAERCRGRWSTLSLNPTDGLFLLWVRQAYPAARRVKASPDPVVAGRTTVTVADSRGPIDASAIATIAAYIGPKLRCVLDGVVVKAATEHTFGLNGFVIVDPTRATAIQEDAQARYAAYLGSIPIGGTVKIAMISDLLMDAGAEDVTGLVLIDGDGAEASNIELDDSEVPVSVDVLANMLQWVFSR